MPRKKATKPPGSYPAHRERQRQRILQAAWALFDQHGIDRVSMADITASSGVQPSTIYQYFANKDEIVWAVLADVMQKASERARSFEVAANGLARITALLEFMADDLVNNPETVRFMAQFDAMYARHWPAERLISLESQINPAGFDAFATLIRDGIADGSLRSDLDPGLTMHAVINTVIGAQRRLVSLGNKVEQEYGQPVDRLFRETIRILLLGLRAPEASPRRQARKTKPSKVQSRKRTR